jgi:hypothetical protein
MLQKEHPLIPRPVCPVTVRPKVKESSMNKREIVHTLLDSVQKGDFGQARSLLADNFQFSGPIPGSINKDVWLSISAGLKTAFPDLDYHFKVLGELGNNVRMTSQLSGTQTGSFDLTAMNMGVISATDKTFSTKPERARVTVKENKITAWAVERTEGAGLSAILDQLGVKSPTV